MKIGNTQIAFENNSLVIRKSKTSKTFQIVFFIVAGLAVFIIPFLAVLNVKGRQWWHDSNVILILSVLLLISVVLVIYNLRRAQTKFRSLILEKVNAQIKINGKVICNAEKLQEIKIKKMTDGDGGTSYNVGLILQNQFFPVCLDQGKEEAMSIASIIAHYFDKEVKFEQGQMILP